jgi:hypothetical protein
MKEAWPCYLGPVWQGSSSAPALLPNVFLNEPFFSKKQMSQSHFGEVTNCGSSGRAPRQEEPCQTPMLQY